MCDKTSLAMAENRGSEPNDEPEIDLDEIDGVDEFVEGVLSNPWPNASPSEAVFLLAVAIAVSSRDGRSTLEVPVDLARVILRCAALGMRKGRGRGRPEDSPLIKTRKRNLVEVGLDREDELVRAAKRAGETVNKAGIRWEVADTPVGYRKNGDLTTAKAIARNTSRGRWTIFSRDLLSDISVSE